jgi:hypothetical protein
MANKKSIQDVDARIAKLIIRIARDANELNELRAKRKKMVTGKLKVPPPPGIRTKFTLPAFDDDISDISERPVAPGATGPC